MDFERQKPVTDDYRENWGRVFQDAFIVEGTLGLDFPKGVSAQVACVDTETQTIYLNGCVFCGNKNGHSPDCTYSEYPRKSFILSIAGKADT